MGKARLFVVGLAVALFVVSGCGSESEGSGGNAHVNEESGSTHGLIRDERVGTPPPPTPSNLPKLRKLAEKAGCFLLLEYREQDAKDLPLGAKAPEYITEPPTSGPHVEVPYQQADGAYMIEPEPINVVAALDHGRMAISYAPDLLEELQLKLKGLYDTMYGGTLLFPDDEMPFAVAATTWSNFLGCTGFEGPKTLDVIRAFGKETWGKYGNQPVDAFPYDGPTPADPEEPGTSE